MIMGAETETDFHRLLPAGLPAHFESDHPSHAVGLRSALAHTCPRLPAPELLRLA
jgi:hypothetical protein